MNAAHRQGRVNAGFAEKCLVASLHATGDNGGIGNIMFEMLGLLGIAQQSFKYFWDLRRAEVLHTVSASDHTIFAAKNLLFAENPLRHRQLNICVHVRRGDFADSKMHLPSDANFTTAGIRFLVEKAETEDYRTPHIYMFTDDVDWVHENIIEPSFHTNITHSAPLVAANFIEKPPNAEWEFSRLYCDRLLLTASTSTYGWWLAFLSRGQRVYYDRNYALPGARSDELSSADFWPQHWTPLQIYPSNHVVEI
ncbi:hypothetical protein NECAME_06713 [Necator americanus]|uniref:Glycosyltransferase, family 11 n=1 Tax=Necator americanus TaxID=51031 RepID=W2TSX2_NECAM|nr:hypothetical protein NECAME_06713 [Necator americanus]ETN84749.1 hypothetical protein NECAME_06713 [Necator americanus]